MKIPMIQAEMLQIGYALLHGTVEARHLTAMGTRIVELANELKRRPGRRAPNASKSMTPAIKAQIRAIYAANPLLTQHEIGTMVGVNAGRVSEVLHGKRT